MKCLITGVNGFAASHLADRLVSQGHEVIGTARIRHQKENISHLNIDVLPMDLGDSYGVSKTIKKTLPDAIFHLAAQSFVGWSWNNPEETMNTNILGTVRLLESVKDFCPSARVQIASSSQVYGKIPMEDQPMGKNTYFNPMNPYDSSKLGQDMVSLQYFNSYKLNIIRTRSFNISGPRRGESFAESSWAKQIVQIEKSGAGSIKHGNLDSYRDYIDVRDVVIGYEKACFEGNPGEVYIFGSGVPRQMRDVLGTLVSKSKDCEISLEEDPSRMRPSDTPYMQAGGSVLSEMIGKPLIPFEKTMEDLLDYWRERENITGNR